MAKLLALHAAVQVSTVTGPDIPTIRGREPAALVGQDQVPYFMFSLV